MGRKREVIGTVTHRFPRERVCNQARHEKAVEAPAQGWNESLDKLAETLAA